MCQIRETCAALNENCNANWKGVPQLPCFRPNRLGEVTAKYEHLQWLIRRVNERLDYPNAKILCDGESDGIFEELKLKAEKK